MRPRKQKGQRTWRWPNSFSLGLMSRRRIALHPRKLKEVTRFWIILVRDNLAERVQSIARGLADAKASA